jgi:hypothetical protein
MKTKTHFTFRVDIWDDAGDSIVEHVAGAGDFEVAVATYWAPVARWPRARITLRQGIRVVHDRARRIDTRQLRNLAAVGLFLATGCRKISYKGPLLSPSK